MRPLDLSLRCLQVSSELLGHVKTILVARRQVPPDPRADLLLSPPKSVVNIEEWVSANQDGLAEALLQIGRNSKLLADYTAEVSCLGELFVLIQDLRAVTRLFEESGDRDLARVVARPIARQPVNRPANGVTPVRAFRRLQRFILTGCLRRFLWLTDGLYRRQASEIPPNAWSHKWPGAGTAISNNGLRAKVFVVDGWLVGSLGLFNAVRDYSSKPRRSGLWDWLGGGVSVTPVRTRWVGQPARSPLRRSVSRRSPTTRASAGAIPAS